MHDRSMPMPTPSHPLLDALWGPYVADVPVVRTFIELNGGVVENDHIAMRTIAHAGHDSGIGPMQRFFETWGWLPADDYVFDDVFLRARYLRQPGLPRVFISELDVDALVASARARAVREDVVARIDGALRAAGAACAEGVPTTRDASAGAAWCSAPSHVERADVDAVEGVSQYGAWCLCFGRRVNHFTAFVDDVPAWQARLLAAGVAMKDSVEGRPISEGGVGLMQTATAAASVPVRFSDGSVSSRPYAYFEIAAREGGFDGFLANQARQLFDQTQR